LDDDEPAEDIYKPDGGYIPRVLFINPDGSVMDDVINEGGNAKYKVCLGNMKVWNDSYIIILVFLFST